MDQRAIKELAGMVLKTLDIQEKGPWDEWTGKPKMSAGDAARTAGVPKELIPFIQLIAHWPADAREAAEKLIPPKKQTLGR